MPTSSASAATLSHSAATSTPALPSTTSKSARRTGQAPRLPHLDGIPHPHPPRRRTAEGRHAPCPRRRPRRRALARRPPGSAHHRHPLRPFALRMRPRHGQPPPLDRHRTGRRPRRLRHRNHHLDEMRADLVGLSLSRRAGESLLHPLGHRTGGGDLFGAAAASPKASSPCNPCSTR